MNRKMENYWDEGKHFRHGWCWLTGTHFEIEPWKKKSLAQDAEKQMRQISFHNIPYEANSFVTLCTHENFWKEFLKFYFAFQPQFSHNLSPITFAPLQPTSHPLLSKGKRSNGESTKVEQNQALPSHALRLNMTFHLKGWIPTS